MLCACLILGASGGVRAWQDHRFATGLNQVQAAPFRLKELPQVLGDWRMVEGGEKNLDPEVARVAGCSDSLVRSYKEMTTGLGLTVLILFGPAQMVASHTPDVCYPSAGYQMVDQPSLREVPYGAGSPAQFRSEIFVRQRDQRRWREEVYYSFRFGDRWLPDAKQFWKEFRHHPSMFKVQIQRPVLESESSGRSEPTEEFLALLLPEIERRLTRPSDESGK